MLWVLPWLIATVWIGGNSAVAIFGGVLAVIVGWGLYGLFFWFRQMWDEFDDELPSEEVVIIRRLKGLPTPSRKEEVYYD